MNTATSTFSIDATIHSGSPVAPRTTAIARRGIAPRNFSPGLLFGFLLLAVTALPTLASDPVGIYAYVDRVVLEPNDTAPERIQVWGGFALAEGSGERYKAAQPGLMYFKVKPGKDTLCQNEWTDLKSVAGTGKLVGFGMRYASNGVVRVASAKIENPDVYPIGMGVQKITVKDYKPINELIALKKADKGNKTK